MSTRDDQGPAAEALRRLLCGLTEKRVDGLTELLLPEVRASVPSAHSPGPLDGEAFLAWAREFTEGRGLVRLDPFGVALGRPDACGARIRYTAFLDPGDPPAHATAEVAPWESSCVVAGLVTRGGLVDRLALVIDDADDPMRADKLRAVLAWYQAYVGHDLDGFLCALSEDLAATSFNGYEPPEPIGKEQYREGFVEWCARNRRGGFVAGEAAVRGSFVALPVQFVAQERASGQQKTTYEIHVIELDDAHRIRRADFFETNRCSDLSSPCRW